jgi:predicted AlkP superfamily pyrophosphatase or phosphodiesterase
MSAGERRMFVGRIDNPSYQARTTLLVCGRHGKRQGPALMLRRKRRHEKRFRPRYNRAMQPVVLLNTVGLTVRHLSLAPRLHALAQQGWHRPLTEVLPAVTCTAQASMLTGAPPDRHGIVGNGWFWRETGEVRFWLQSNRLIEAEPVYATARRLAAARGESFRCAKLFWWFNQGADVDISVTPKPHYGADGNKFFDVTGTPEGIGQELQKRLGPFPFASFWGPMAGLPSTDWIARCAAQILDEHRPDLTLVYLPHLDYDTQRLGPDGCDWPRLVGELDAACAPVLDAAARLGAQVWVVNEYPHLQVRRPVYMNRILREAGWLRVRPGPFGEALDTFGSEAFAVCDHQLAHVHVRDPGRVAAVADRLRQTAGVGEVYVLEERAAVQLNHVRAGDIVALSEPDAWFAYPFWFDDRAAPDYARTVNIHAKPGYDPCELFLDPKLAWPKGRLALRYLQKKLGFRTLFDVVPLDAGLVRGSHGLRCASPEDRPVCIGRGPAPESEVSMTGVRDLILNALALDR